MTTKGNYDIVIENFDNFESKWFQLDELKNIFWNLNIKKDEHHLSAYLKCMKSNMWPVVAYCMFEIETLDGQLIKKIAIEPFIFEENKQTSGNKLTTLETIREKECDGIKISCTIIVNTCTEVKLICHAETIYGNGMTNDRFIIEIEKFSSMMSVKQIFTVRGEKGYITIYKSSRNTLCCVVKFDKPQSQPIDTSFHLNDAKKKYVLHLNVHHKDGEKKRVFIMPNILHIDDLLNANNGYVKDDKLNVIVEIRVNTASGMCMFFY